MQPSAPREESEVGKIIHGGAVTLGSTDTPLQSNVSRGAPPPPPWSAEPLPFPRVDPVEKVLERSFSRALEN